MLPRHQPDRIRIAFDDRRLVANAGLILPATLARRLGLPKLVHNHLDLGRAPGRANTGDKMMTLVASALAGGDCIDDAGVLRTGRTACTLDGTVKAPSTLGTFLRSFRWGHIRQLGRVSRELLARAWKAGAGPDDAPFTIDLDSTICETYGLAKEGARHHGYTGAQGYHPLLAVAGASGDVLLSMLRPGRGGLQVDGASPLLWLLGPVKGVSRETPSVRVAVERVFRAGRVYGTWRGTVQEEFALPLPSGPRCVGLSRRVWTGMEPPHAQIMACLYRSSTVVLFVCNPWCRGPV